MRRADLADLTAFVAFRLATCVWGRHRQSLLPASDAPMDFSAWFEAYIGGEWYTFDARNNVCRVLIAGGRDAEDVAISTTFGPNRLNRFTVWTEEVLG
jgi:transglutaminase-like putative cysteine protease